MNILHLIKQERRFGCSYYMSLYNLYASSTNITTVQYFNYTKFSYDYINVIKLIL